jgi:hypothetical protein
VQWCINFFAWYIFLYNHRSIELSPTWQCDNRYTMVFLKHDGQSPSFLVFPTSTLEDCWSILFHWSGTPQSQRYIACLGIVQKNHTEVYLYSIERHLCRTLLGVIRYHGPTAIVYIKRKFKSDIWQIIGLTFSAGNKAQSGIAQISDLKSNYMPLSLRACVLSLVFHRRNVTPAEVMK